MTSNALNPPDPGARLIARVLHDVAGPTSGLATALDLLADARQSDLHADAMALAKESLTRLADKIAFARAVFGESVDPVGETFLRLADGALADGRARLEAAPLSVEAPPGLARALLVLVQIAGDTLPMGGAVRLEAAPEGQAWRARVEARGERLQWRDDVAAGLAGEAPPGGPSARWAPAAWVRERLTRRGAQLDIRRGEAALILDLSWPAPNDP
ncbi:MAG: hypothetical protein KGL69_01715 [Alphaproteobacteria bacterium]|jgi:histidine phosphotransferase ChpT|nr:hypothetical protein [Alphaproteobacteria bacterium]